FHRAHLQYFGALRRQFQHVFESNLTEPPRLRHYARVGSIDAIDIGVDIATVGMNRSRDRHRRRIGTAAPKRGDSLRLRVDALEAGDHRDFVALLETLDQFAPVDLENAGRSVGVAGRDRNLPALPGAGL